MNIAFLLPVPSQSRFHKRASELKKAGAETVILSFERKYYEGEGWPDGYVSLGELDHGNYLNRLVPLLTSILTVNKATCNSEIIYAFGLDMLFLGWLVSVFRTKKIKLVYEVGDIRRVLQGKGYLPRILRTLERFLMKRISLLVVTSEAYVSGYFEKVQGLKNINYRVVENKLRPGSITKKTWRDSTVVKKPFIIGYFGLLRCERSLKILKRVAEKGKGSIIVHLRGMFFENKQLDIKNKVITHPNVEFFGPYVAPDDLFDIYDQVDLVWASYPFMKGSENDNWRWARTVRFYEAGFFNKPMLVQEGTQDCSVVNQYDIGLCLDLSDIEKATESILDISVEDIIDWINNIEKVSSKEFVYSDEHKKLLEDLQ